MAKEHQPRRKIGFAMLVIIGLLLGLAIKHVAIGLIIGLVFGLLASGMIDGGRNR
ncbi:MAG: hypothetical protein M3040_16325 [Bacteroidota bacterium]|nr:hypothetical protein [Bacteroidota bacterium]